MKNFLVTFILALYEGASMIWAFCPIKSTEFIGVDEAWVWLNRDLLAEASFLNLMIAIIILCLMCYNQGLEDGKHEKH